MLKIRLATVDDLEALVQLRLALLREIGNLNDADTTPLTEATEQYLSQKLSQGFTTWIADVDGKIIATSDVVIFERPPVEKNLLGLETYLMNIYTIPQYRGNSIAAALLKLLAFVKKTGARRIWLHATKDGQHLYEKLGFVSTTTEMELVW